MFGTGYAKISIVQGILAAAPTYHIMKRLFLASVLFVSGLWGQITPFPVVTAHSFAATFATQPQGTTIYLPPALFSGRITSWRVTVDAGTATVDVWKVVVGSFPTVANTVTASATPAVSSGTTASSSTLTGWTTTVAVGDMVAINLRTISGASVVNIEVYYQ